MADDLANLVARHMFPRPVSGSGVLSANAPRLEPRADRFGVDADFNNDGLPDNPHNFAPYSVVPWTNWPDCCMPMYCCR